MSTKPSESDRFVLHYEQGMLRSAFRSLFWSIISERKKSSAFSLKALVALLPRGDKGKVSKWFNGDPNWTINTIGTLSHALNVDIRIEAIDRTTGVVYTPSGLQTTPTVQYIEPAMISPVANARLAAPIFRKLPAGVTVHSVSEAA